jgi:hypothetical protein
VSRGITVSVKFTDKGLKEITKRLVALDGMAVEVGFLGADGQARHPNSSLTVAGIAAIHEFGVELANGGEIPERSFMRSAIRMGADKLARVHAEQLALVIAEKKTAEAALAVVGGFALELIRQRLKTAASWADQYDADTADDERTGSMLDQSGVLERSLSWRVVGRTGKTLAEGKR